MIWNSTLEKLMLIKPAELTLDDFKIDFENEDGWDAGKFSSLKNRYDYKKYKYYIVYT